MVEEGRDKVVLAAVEAALRAYDGSSSDEADAEDEEDEDDEDA